MALERFPHGSYPSNLYDIVAVAQGNVLRPGSKNADVPRVAYPWLIGGSDETNTWIDCDVLLGNLCGAISRAIIDNDNFPLTIPLLPKKCVEL